MAITKGTPVITHMPLDNPTAFNVPAYVAGDVWIAVLHSRATTDFELAAGWTLVANNRATTTSAGVRNVIWYRIPDGSEGSSQSITKLSTNSLSTAVVYAMSGVDTTAVLDGDIGVAASGTIAETTFTNPGITTTADDSFLFDVQGGNLSTTDIVFTEPAGMTKDVDDDSSYNDLNINYQQLGTAGPTGPKNGGSDVATRWLTTTFALTAAPEDSTPKIQQICVSRGVGVYASGQRHNVWFHRLDPFTPNANTGVILAPGFLGTADYFTEYYSPVDLKAKELAQRIPMQRVPAIATDMGGSSTWGNDTAIAACGSTLTYLNTATKARTDRVVLVGLSMGALTVLNWARANPSKVAAIGLFLPAVNLADIHDNDRSGLASAIESAYGGAAGYAADGPSHDPANFTSSYTGMPIRIWYSTDDTTAVPSVVTAFGTAVGATLTSMGNVGHSISSLDAVDAAQWLASFNS